MFTTRRSWRFISQPLFTSVHSAGKVFNSFRGAGCCSSPPRCLKAWTPTASPCVLSAAACAVIGWHQTSFFFLVFFSLLQRGMAGASRLGRVQTTDMGGGHARRHLRHNLHLTAQPLSPCKTHKKKSRIIQSLSWRRKCVCVSS